MPSRKSGSGKQKPAPKKLTPAKVSAATAVLARRQDVIPTYKDSGLIQRRSAASLFRKGQPIPPVITREDAARQFDGWTNVLAGLGFRMDKSARTQFQNWRLILDPELHQMYMGDGLVTRIIDCVAEDMTREWIDLEGELEDEEQEKKDLETVSDVLEELDTEVAFNTALKWKRLYGGALIVMGIIDGKTPDQPVDFARVRGMSGLRVVDRVDVHIWNSIFDTDVMSPTFGQPLVYDVIFHIGVTRVEQFVHASRCIPLFGKRVPQNLAYLMNMEHRYWGLSEVQFVYEKLRDFGSVTGSVVNIIMEFLIGKYTLTGLADMIAEGNEQSAITRMEIISMCKSVINGVLLGEGETFERDAATVTGIPEIIDRFMMIISGVVGIPVTRLFGRSAAGMDATGDNDMKQYYDRIRSNQKTELKPALRKLIEMICAWKKIKTSPQVKFNKLEQMTEKEEADIKKAEADTEFLKAQTAEKYITNQVLLPTDVYARDFADEIDPLRAAAAGEMTEGSRKRSSTWGMKRSRSPSRLWCPRRCLPRLPSASRCRRAWFRCNRSRRQGSPRKREAGRRDRKDHLPLSEIISMSLRSAGLGAAVLAEAKLLVRCNQLLRINE